MERYKQRGDREVVGELYKRYVHLVYGVCLQYLRNRDDSKDAVMQIFEKLFVSLKEHDVENFKSWLHVTTKNHCLMALRKIKKSDLGENIDTSVMELSQIDHHEDEMELEDNLTLLQKCMEQLKEAQKMCIQLFFIEKKCYNEIVGTTSYPLKKVKSYIQNGKRNLKLCMERSG